MKGHAGGGRMRRLNLSRLVRMLFCMSYHQIHWFVINGSVCDVQDGSCPCFFRVWKQALEM